MSSSGILPVYDLMVPSGSRVGGHGLNLFIDSNALKFVRSNSGVGSGLSRR